MPIDVGSIPSDKVLTKEETVVIKESLGMLIFKQLIPVKNDHVDDYDRGTVKYMSSCRNYSFHKVEIPNGSEINNSNFTQRKPNTVAITGKNLVFKQCNLVNNTIDVSWVLEKCNVSQHDFEKEEADILAAELLAKGGQ